MVIITERAEQAMIRIKEDEYRKFMTLALDAQKGGDGVLSQRYYQQAEYYLHLINNPDERLQVSHSSFKKPASGKKITRNPDIHSVVPFRGSFLRRNRHVIHPPRHEHDNFKE